MRKIEEQFNEYLSYCQNVRLMSQQTMQGKKWVLHNFLENTNVTNVTLLSNRDVTRWIESQTARGVAGRTINTRLAHLIAALRYFQDMGVNMPDLKLRLLVKAKEQPPRRTYYSKEQIDKVLSFADRLEWLLISMCYDCGFRISELRNLRLLNIDGQKVNFVGKGSKARESYMSTETRRRLDSWIQRERIVDYLWVREGENNKKPLTIEEIRHLMKKPFEKAGFVDFYPHALRHSFATGICESGAPLPIAQKMLGHSNLATTERYVHTFDGHLREYFNEYKFAVA